jgi:exopolysaccharide production protein ExoY
MTMDHRLAPIGKLDRTGSKHSAGAASSGQSGVRPFTIYIKRTLDVALAACGLVFFAPLMTAIAVALLIQDGRPVFYKQRRIGLDGRPFLCWKFRSMTRDADQQLGELLYRSETCRRQWQSKQKLDHDPRVHPIGAVLRKSSLDELPQFVNVLRGDMSIVGPRPIVPEELTRYGKNAKYYLAQRPGITGLWQVSDRSNTSYDERVALDVRYCKTWTIGGDIAIMARTLVVLLTSRGSC